MSYFDYQVSRQIDAQDAPFSALIMAAYRKADTNNQELLEQAFPEACRELRERYNAPGGLLPGEVLSS